MVMKVVTPKPKFGKLLKRIRESKGVSLRELAREAGVDHSYLHQIERGKVGVPVGTLPMAIARHLNSPELLGIAEWALVRQLLIVEGQRAGVYDEMTAELRKELGITDNDLEQIKQMISKLVPRLLDAKLRREGTPKLQGSRRGAKYIAKVVGTKSVKPTAKEKRTETRTQSPAKH